MDTKNNIELRKSLDRAIEEGSIEDIKSIINNIPNCTPPVSVKELTEKVRADNKEEKFMKNKKSVKLLIAVAAISVITCASVGAATLLKNYVFDNDGRFISVVSNSDISENEAKELVKDYTQDYDKEKSNYIAPEYMNFETIEEAEKELDMDIVTPGYKPDIELSEIQGIKTYISENSSSATAWITYGSPESGICYGITATKMDYQDKDVTSVLSTDSQMTGEEFVSDKGFKYSLLEDKDENSDRVAYMYLTYAGDYEYSVNFFGFDKAEMEKVVNSVDLSEYVK